MSEKTYKTGSLVSLQMLDSVQSQSGCRGIDLIILPHLVAFFLEHAVYELDTTPGLLRNILPDVEVLSVIPDVLVPVVRE